MLSVERYNGTTWVNISDYVISEGTGKIPFIERNSDWSPIASTFDLGVSSAFGTAIVRGDRFRFYNDTQIIFAGYADQVIYDYDRRYYRVQLVNDLMKLDSYKLEHSVLGTLIETNGGDLFKYNPSDSQGYPNVNLLWAMQCCFTAAGMSLDVTDVADLVYYDFSNPSFPDVTYSDLAMDYNMLYCLGQTSAAYRSDLDDPNQNFISSKITLWDFMQELFRYFGFTLVLQDVNSYKLLKEDTAYTIADDNKYRYETDTKLAEYPDKTIYTEFYTVDVFRRSESHPIRWFYSGSNAGTPKECAKFNVNLQAIAPVDYTMQAIDWMPHFVVVPYESTGTPLVFTPDISDSNFLTYHNTSTPYYTYSQFGLIPMARERVKYYTLDKQTESITTDYNTTVKSVLKNFIDINNRTSEIEQETYL
jgi:hypothetical protein